MDNGHISTNTTAHQFFYGVGLGTCSLAAYWFYNNCYPITTQRILADAALGYCRAEVYAQRVFGALGVIFAPFLAMFKSNKEEPNLYLHHEDGSITRTTYHEFLNRVHNWKFAYIEYYITNDSGDSCCRIYRSSEELLSPEGDACKSSPFSVMTVFLCYDGKEVPIELPNTNFYLCDNVLFDRDFLEKTLGIDDIPEEYSVSIIDGNVNSIKLEHNKRKKQSIRLTENGHEIVTVCVAADGESMDDCEDADSTEDDCVSATSSGIFSWFSSNSTKPKEA